MANIDDLTYGELKQIAALFNATTQQTKPQDDDFVGKYVLCRCYSAGVHSGILVSQDRDQVVLKDSRRLWKWETTGVALSGVAQLGLTGGKLDVVNPLIKINGVVEVIVCTDKARDSIHGFNN